MKIEKITDTFVNEFDAQAQSCSDDCEEYRGKKEADVNYYIKRNQRKIREFDSQECKDAKEAGYVYCYLDHTPKTTIYW